MKRIRKTIVHSTCPFTYENCLGVFRMRPGETTKDTLIRNHMPLTGNYAHEVMGTPVDTDDRCRLETEVSP